MKKKDSEKKLHQQLVEITRNVTKNSSFVIFTGKYQIEKNGFAKIWKADWKSNDIKVTIKRSKDTNISIIAKMDFKLAEEWCNWKKDSYYFAHIPWWSDENYDVCSTIFEEKGSKIFASKLVSLRGDNRIFIELRESCEYDITIPEDCDYETNLNSSEITGSLPDFFSGVQFSVRKELSKYLMEKNVEENSENSENSIDDSIEYSGRYPIDAKGLVRIYQKFNDKINVVIKKGSDANLSINAKVEKKYAWTNELIELPWSTNAIIGEIINVKSIGSKMSASQLLTFKGGNRIDVVLNEIGNYVIMIPFDADFETDFETADVKIEPFIHPTSLHVDCCAVNVWGDNGMSSCEKQSWDYYSFGHRSDPYTRIKTNGDVNVPIKEVLPEWLMTY